MSGRTSEGHAPRRAGAPAAGLLDRGPQEECGKACSTCMAAALNQAPGFTIREASSTHALHSASTCTAYTASAHLAVKRVCPVGHGAVEVGVRDGHGGDAATALLDVLHHILVQQAHAVPQHRPRLCRQHEAGCSANNAWQSSQTLPAFPSSLLLTQAPDSALAPPPLNPSWADHRHAGCPELCCKGRPGARLCAAGRRAARCPALAPPPPPSRPPPLRAARPGGCCRGTWRGRTGCSCKIALGQTQLASVGLAGTG